MKLITGLFMAWGNFLSVPCPCKKWDSDLKNYMLACLPSVGLIIGLLWAAACLLLIWIGTPFLVLSFIMTFLLFALCGFMHLDGFMDCCDAIMSRRPMEEKQRILKDSHCGAFSVVSLVFMILGFYSMISTSLSMGLDFVDLCIIPVISRAAAGVNVILRKPLGHSQYSLGAGADDKKQKKNALIIMSVQVIIFGAAAMVFATDRIPTLTVMAAAALGSYLSAVFAKRKLGGMSGDIAGFSIVWGEFAGILAMLII